MQSKLDARTRLPAAPGLPRSAQSAVSAALSVAAERRIGRRTSAHAADASLVASNAMSHSRAEAHAHSTWPLLAQTCDPRSLLADPCSFVTAPCSLVTDPCSLTTDPFSLATDPFSLATAPCSLAT
ncbi:MAG TPA: hypothetical protein PLW65_12155, partial [Pseudomonadota bacterium]|nr:hypothetical protein [Pseudomonadota bacterium]